MKILDLRDNALFLQNWRERMRQPTVISGVAITLIIILLIFVSAFYGQDAYRYSGYNSQYQIQDAMFWLKKSLWQILMLQGGLMLVLGTWSVTRMASRERRSGTLEFHRNSPTTRLNQALGLILGAPSLEWCLFALTFIFVIPLSLIVGFSFIILMKFYVSLIFMVFFYHTIFVLFALSSTSKSQAAFNRLPGILMFIGIYVLVITMRTQNLSVLYHATFFPAYDEVWRSLFPMAYQENSYRNFSQTLYLNSWWGIALPSLILQALVQLPLLIFAFKGIERKISTFDIPLFSKAQMTTLSFLVLFLFLGSAYSFLIYGNMYNYDYGGDSRVRWIIYSFICFAFFFGLGGTLLATPKQLSFFKGLLRAKRSGKNKFDLSSDSASHVGWLCAYALVLGSTLLLLSYVLSAPVALKILVGLNILIYVAVFSGALEYFRLSVHHKKTAIFGTIVGSVWIVIPILAEILKNKVIDINVYYVLTSLSPFSRIELFTSVLTRSNSFSTFTLTPLQVLFQGAIVNLLLAGVFQILASRERKKWQTLAAKSN